MVALARAAAASKGWKARASYRSMDHLVAKFEHVVRSQYWLGSYMKSSECGAITQKWRMFYCWRPHIEAHPITLAQSVRSRTFQWIQTRHEAHVDGQRSEGIGSCLAPDITGRLRFYEERHFDTEDK